MYSFRWVIGFDRAYQPDQKPQQRNASQSKHRWKLNRFGRSVGPPLGRGLVQIVFNFLDLVSPLDESAIFVDDAVSGHPTGGIGAGPEEQTSTAGLRIDPRLRSVVI